MKALSIRQPWAWLITHGYKDIENRSRRTKHRGPFLIHASLQMDKEMHQNLLFWARGIFFDSISPGFLTPKDRPDLVRLAEEYTSDFDLALGGIVGTAELIDCVSESDSLWFSGPYGYVLAHAKPRPFMACRGKLGFFDVADEIARAV